MIRSPIHERQDGDILVSTDETRLDLDTVHGFLAGSYWAAGIPREVVERSIRHSICFGAFDRGRQVGFARVISDRATFAYVADVFVLDDHRGRGIGKQERAILTKSDSQTLKQALAVADDVGWLNRNLWAGLVPYYGSSAITLLGSPQDLAECFLEYKRIGVTQFIISGWPKLDEMLIFGREVLPLVRSAESH